jgi:hypothetical protein
MTTEEFFAQPGLSKAEVLREMHERGEVELIELPMTERTFDERDWLGLPHVEGEERPPLSEAKKAEVREFLRGLFGDLYE